MSHSCKSHSLHLPLLPQQSLTSVTEQQPMLQINVLDYCTSISAVVEQ